MRCPSCDKDNPDKARFCIHCGTKLQDNPKKAEVSKATSTSVSVSVSENTTKKIESKVDSQNDSLESADVASISTDQVSETKSENSSLKNAVATNKKRSRRRVPLVIVVALALALSASAAFAAYYVYTEVWLPSQQEQGQQDETQSAEYQAAIKAYDEVLDEYSRAIPTSSTGILSNPDSSYKYINSMSLGNSYFYKDINEDNIPELFIGYYHSPSAEIEDDVETSAIYSIYSFQNNKVTKVFFGWDRSFASLRENNKLLVRSSGGYDSASYSAYSFKTPPFSDIKGNGDNGNLEPCGTFSFDGIDYRNTTGYLSCKETENGEQLYSKVCSKKEMEALLNDFLSKYPEDTSVEWKDIPLK